MKIIFSTLLLLLNFGCSNTNLKQSNLENYYSLIDKKIEIERDKNPRGIYRQKKTEEEIGNTPYSQNGKVKIITENGYRNYYNAYDNNLQKSIKLDEKMLENGVIKTFYPTGSLKTIGYIENGNIITGILREFYETGELYKEIPYYKGKKEGIEKIYYKSGKIKQKIPYINNLLNGKRVFYYENGNIKEEYSYIDGKENGLGFLYYPTGEKKQIEEYKLGRKNGNYTIYYRNGNIKEEGFFYNFHVKGPFKLYYEDGSPKLIGECRGSLLEGEGYIYSKKGDRKRVIFKKGKIITED